MEKGTRMAGIKIDLDSGKTLTSLVTEMLEKAIRNNIGSNDVRLNMDKV